MAIGTIQRVRVVGSKTVPRLVTAPVTFAVGGTATVNATDLEADKILGVLGATAWGAAAENCIAVSTTTPFSESGVTLVVLQIVDGDQDFNDQALTATVLFECE